MTAQGDEPLCVVLCNAPPDRAGSIARALVERRLAACVSVAPSVVSHYRWEGALHEDVESTLFVKTRLARLAEVTAAIRELHPYTVPEVIALPLLDGGNSAYRAWVVAESTEPSPA